MFTTTKKNRKRNYQMLIVCFISTSKATCVCVCFFLFCLLCFYTQCDNNIWQIYAGSTNVKTEIYGFVSASACWTSGRNNNNKNTASQERRWRGSLTPLRNVTIFIVLSPSRDNLSVHPPNQLQTNNPFSTQFFWEIK